MNGRTEDTHVECATLQLGLIHRQDNQFRKESFSRTQILTQIWHTGVKSNSLWSKNERGTVSEWPAVVYTHQHKYVNEQTSLVRY